MAIVFLTHLDQDIELLESLDESLPRFGAERARLLVVAPCPIARARDFAEGEAVEVPILADEAGHMARRIGAEEARVRRLLVVAGSADGRLVARFDSVSSDELVDRLLAEVRDLEPGGDVEGSGSERTGVSKIGHEN